MHIQDERIGIIGPGLTGGGLAALFAGHGCHTVVLGKDTDDTRAGIARIHACFEQLVARELITAKQASACKARVTAAEDYSALSGAGLIYECVPEDLALKQKVYAQVEKHCSGYRALVSATSALLPDALALELSDRTRFLVAHPWNPPHLVPCVELACCATTNIAACEYTRQILQATGREPIVMNTPAAGFIGNRLQHAMYREAVYMVEAGIASPEDIDRTILTSFGPRYAAIGIFEHFDLVGLHTAKAIEDYLLPELCSSDRPGLPLTQAVAEGRLGMRTGSGMLDWSQRDPQEVKDRAAAPYWAMFNWKLPPD